MKKILLVITLLTCYIINYAQIYIVGNESSNYDSTASYGNYKNISYYKNGVCHTLFNTEHPIVATDIFVSDTNIYIIGDEVDTNSVLWFSGLATQGYLWHNGVKQNLTDTTQWSSAYSIAVANGDIYITGYVSTSTNIHNNFKNVATLWKNGVAQPLEPDTINSSAVSVFIEDTNVYVVSSSLHWINPMSSISFSVISIWKNGEKIFAIGDGATYSCSPLGLYVANGDVYVAGYQQTDRFSGTSRAVIWKNGVPQYLTNNYSAEFPYARAICVIDNDVYAAGRGYFSAETGTIAVVWKNGVLLPTLYSDYIGMGAATDIAVINNDIYVLTNQNNSAYVWKNEELVYVLRPENLPYFEATAMFINPDSLPNIAIPQQPAYNQAIKLYPNPAQSYITVELSREIPTAEFQLFDLQGRLLKREKISTHSTVNILGLQQGIYLYKVTSDRQQYNGKLLITR